MDDFEQLTSTRKSQKHYPLLIEGDDGMVTFNITPAPVNPNLPSGAENCSTPLDFVEKFLYMKDNIAVIAEQVKQAFAAHQPEEWGVEFNIGFKTEGGIPFIAKGEANAALKVTAKWKKND